LGKGGEGGNQHDTSVIKLVGIVRRTA
jgi:hypothetical protein